LGQATLGESRPAPGTATYDSYLPPQSSSSPNSQTPLIPSPAEPGFKGALKKSATKVSSWFTIQPKVIPADDAVSLASSPPPIGANVFLVPGKWLESRGDFPGALSQYEKALQTDPRNLAALLSLARIHCRQSNFEQAETLYQRAIKFHPDSAPALNDLGLCYSHDHKPDQAIAVLERAVQLDPKRDLYRNNLAAALVKAGRPAEALDQLLAVQGEAVAHYNVGFFLYQLGAPDQAARYFERALEKDPALKAAQQMLARSGSTRPAPVATASHISDSSRSTDSSRVTERSARHAPHVPIRLPGSPPTQPGLSRE
jgi:Tfp pilus assembly protein PilF